jgi:hypothetical protein
MSRPTLATLTPAEPVPFEALAELYRQDGYRPGLPRHVSREAVQIDRDVLAAEVCPFCGQAGLALVPYHHPGGRGYRILAHCPGCGAASEM